MAKLIIVEGIPGSGKTTFAGKIKDYYDQMNKKVHLFREGELHPTDLGWQAVLTKSEFDDVFNKNPDLQESLLKHSASSDDEVIVAYNMLGITLDNKETKDYLAKKEVYDGNVEYERFYSLHKKRWHRFLNDQFEKDDVYIFECSYLQNHITELVLTYNKSKQEITQHLLDLVNIETNLDIKLIYIDSTNVEETIGRVAKERVSNDSTRWISWIDRVIKYVEDSNYGKLHNVVGYEGFIDFTKLRKEIEIHLMPKLPMEVSIIENSEFDWPKVWANIKEAL